MKSLALLILIIVGHTECTAQTPRIHPGGVVNAASFVGNDILGGYLAPGSIASIFGENLASRTAVAQSAPYPLELADVRVYFGDVAAPLLFVSSGQINVQVPNSVEFLGQGKDLLTRVNIIVSNGDLRSAPFEVLSALGAPGIFTLDGSGCGLGVVINTYPDRLTELHGPDHSVQPGDIITVFYTGGGLHDNTLAWLGRGYRLLTVQYHGPAPGLPGLDQCPFHSKEAGAAASKFPSAFITAGESACLTRILSPRSSGIGSG